MYEISGRQTNGEDFTFLFYVLEDDDSVPTDFADYEFELVVTHVDTEEEVFVLTNGDGLTPSIVAGSVTVYKALGDHDLYGNNRYNIGARWVNGSGLTKQAFTGVLTVIEGNFRD